MLPQLGRGVQRAHVQAAGQAGQRDAAAPGHHLLGVDLQVLHLGLLRQLGRAQVVTVSDIDGFARAGGMVELAVNPEGGNLLNILINRKAAQAQNIQFNAQLLRLARVVEP